MLGKADVIAQDVAKYRGKLTRMEGRLEDSNSVILEQLHVSAISSISPDW